MLGGNDIHVPGLIGGLLEAFYKEVRLRDILPCPQTHRGAIVDEGRIGQRAQC